MASLIGGHKNSTRLMVLLAGLGCQLVTPQGAQAHVKWFPSTDEVSNSATQYFSIHEPAVILCLILLAVGLFTAWWLNDCSETMRPARRLSMLGRVYWQPLVRAVGAIFGLSLLYSAYNGALFAPHLSSSGVLFDIFRILEGVSGILFIMGVGGCTAVFLLITVWLGIAYLFGGLSALEYMSTLGVAVFLSASCKRHWRRERIHRLVVMRITLGLSLAVLALTEKLLDPTPAIQLLQEQNFNFMKLAGFNYSDRLFVLSAGVVELLIGLCFVLGISTRFSVLVLSAFLVASNSYFFVTGDVESAMLEAMGHAPLFAALLPLLLYGRGQLVPGRGYMGAPVGRSLVKFRFA